MNVPRLEVLTGITRSKPRIARDCGLVLILASLACGLSPGSAAGASDASTSRPYPAVVSPGSSTISLASDACPTFSWGVVAGAERYELAVHLLADEKAELKPVLSQSLPGSASSWTPPLDLCLNRGARYAWSVRAIEGEKTSDWAPRTLFHVAAGPSEVELREALSMAERYLAKRDQAANARVIPDPAAVGAPQALAPAGTQLTVDGNLHAESFSGDSSLLTDLKPDPPCFNATDRFVNCGNGTVTDTKTGLIWTRQGNCLNQQMWTGASSWVTGTLADGQCGLTDGSRPGDWRLPTPEEWQTILEPTCPNQPKIAGGGSPTPGCFSDSSWAVAVPVGPPNVYHWSLGEVGSPISAERANLSAGTVGGVSKGSTAYIWPVRSSR